MATIKTVILDDETPARQLIREFLQDHPEIEIVGEYGKSREALEFLRKHEADLLFLDIHMPGLDGFEVLENLENMPEVIFSTAYDQYAVRAFEVNAVDYLLKPYSKERFQQALGKVLDHIHRGKKQQKPVEAAISQFRNREWYPGRLFVRTGKKIKPVPVEQIIRIDAEKDYARIYTQNDTYLSGMSLGALEQQLDPAMFIRTHRSHIVALDSIQELEADGYSGYTITLEDGSKVRVSRNYAETIKTKLV